MLLTEYEAFRLVWHEQWRVGVGNGILVGMILGGILLAVFALDQMMWPVPDPDAAPPDPPPAVAPLKPPRVRYYWITWWLLLLLAVVPPLLCKRDAFRVKYPVPEAAEGGS